MPSTLAVAPNHAFVHKSRLNCPKAATRYGRGVPGSRARRRPHSGAVSTYFVHQFSHGFRCRVLRNAVPQVEHVTSPWAEGIQHLARLPAYRFWRRKQRHGIEIALQRHLGADASPRAARIGRPVQSQPIWDP